VTGCGLVFLWPLKYHFSINAASTWGYSTLKHARKEMRQMVHTRSVSSSVGCTSRIGAHRALPSIMSYYTALGCSPFAPAFRSWKPSGFACVCPGGARVSPSTVESARLPFSIGFSVTGLATSSRVRACVDIGPYMSMWSIECHSR